MLASVCSRLQRDDAGSDEVREPLALLVRQDGVDLAQRLLHGVLQLLRRLHAQRAALACLGLVERAATDGVGERGRGAPLVDLRLRALGLELVQDARQIADLLLLELELVRQKAQRAPHAELAAVAAAGPAPRLLPRRAAVMPAPTAATVLGVLVLAATRA